MRSPEQWSDLRARMLSAAAMVVIGLLGIWLGGHIFHLLVAMVCAVMVWELVTMLRPAAGNAALLLGGVTAAALLAAVYLPLWLGLPVLLLPALLGFGLLPQNRRLYLTYAVIILLAGFGLMQLRDDMGFGWLMWLVAVVVVTDVVGYFAGRAFGGPKFWPAISPKKTWSGTASGWVGAAIVGLLFSINTGLGLQLLAMSVALSMASQMGDIAESAIKRKTGVKDSSNLIPGHGGLLDRFDGMLGAAVFLLIVGPLVGLPPTLG